MGESRATPLRVLDGHTGVIHRIAWSPNGVFLASPARDATVRVWQALSGELAASLSTESAWGNSVAWSPENDYLACGTEDGHLYLWNTTDWNLVRRVSAHRGRIECIAWSPADNRLATAGADGTVGIWRLPEIQQLSRLTAHRNWVNGVAWSSDGMRLVTGAEDNTVRIWATGTGDEIARIDSFSDWVTDVSWSHDDALIFVASGTEIHVIDATSGRLLHALSGHTGRAKCQSLSHDGMLLATKGEDQTVRLWRTSDWAQLWSIEEPTTVEMNPESSIAFHPTLPILATLGSKDSIIRLWDTDRLADSYRNPVEALNSYQSAKVILVGGSGAGKTCIARALSDLPFEPQESTHGMKVWQFEQGAKSDGGLAREIYLWDLAGQTDYQIVHQLFLEAASVAVIVFDPTEPIDAQARVEHWVSAVRQAAPHAHILLVAGRIDRGALPIAAEEFLRPIERLGLSEFYSCSSRTGEGIKELRDAIASTIPWASLPTTHSPTAWEEIKAFVINQRQAGQVLARTSDLRFAFRMANPSRELTVEAFDAVVGNLQAQGLVWRFSFGDLLLLQPELMNDYASSIVMAARNHPLGLGAVLERDILDGQFDLSSVPRIEGRENERSVLHAVVELLLERQLALREGAVLVFPSKFRKTAPAPATDERRELEYKFYGFSEQIYASLVVRLSYSGAFVLRACFASKAWFDDLFGRKCSVGMVSGNDSHTLTVSFSRQASVETRVVFARFVHDHLKEKGAAKGVTRRRIYFCDNCNMEIENEKAINARIASGKEFIVCQFCDHQVAITDDLEPRFSSSEVTDKVVRLEVVGAQVTDSVVGVVTANAKKDVEQFDVFLAYSGADEDSVEAVAEELRRRKINPWFAKWCIPPGRMFQKEIDKVFFSIPSIAGVCGKKWSWAMGKS